MTIMTAVTGFRTIAFTGVACLSAVLLAAAAAAQSAARPFWTEQAMFRVGDELYFVGVASCAATPEEGRRTAFESGMRELEGYARERETAGLLVETAMIYEEPNAPSCSRGTTSVWRLLRIAQSRIMALPHREGAAGSASAQRSQPSAGAQGPDRSDSAVAPLQDLTPHIGMSPEDIAQRFGRPTDIRRRGREEIWEYGDTGLTITFSPEETLVRWVLTGKPDPPSERSAPAEAAIPAMAAKPPSEPASVEQGKPMALPPPIPLSKDPVEEGRRLFNGKGACNTCHGRDADMFTDVRRDEFYGVMPGYLPPIIGPFAGPSPRRVPPNLRDWSALHIRTDLDLYRAIKNGIAGSTMTGTRHLTDSEISDLIAYLNSLR